MRMKRAPNILQSIMGAFFGVVLLIASPVAMWMAYEQNRAADFETAIVTQADVSAEGYILVEGAPSYGDESSGVACVDGPCIYQKAVDQEQFTRVELECSNNVRESENLRILRQNGAECDSNGDCVPCYDVEKKVWEEQKTDYTLYPVVVGSYVIEPSQQAEYIETREKTINRDVSLAGNPQRTIYTYFSMPTKLLVAGESDGETIREGEKTYVFSQFNQATTLEKLKTIDRTNRFALYGITFFVVFIGLALMLGPLAWFGSLARFIPVLGPMFARGSNTLVALLALLLAVPVWVIIFVAVTVLQVWWAAVLAIIAVGALVFWLIRRGQSSEGVA